MGGSSGSSSIGVTRTGPIKLVFLGIRVFIRMYHIIVGDAMGRKEDVLPTSFVIEISHARGNKRLVLFDRTCPNDPCVEERSMRLQIQSEKVIAECNWNPCSCPYKHFTNGSSVFRKKTSNSSFRIFYREIIFDAGVIEVVDVCVEDRGTTSLAMSTSMPFTF